MTTARDEIALTAFDGRLFVAGGKTVSTPATSSATVESFRPPETTWWPSDTNVATMNQMGTGSPTPPTLIGRLAVGGLDRRTALVRPDLVLTRRRARHAHPAYDARR